MARYYCLVTDLDRKLPVNNCISGSDPTPFPMELAFTRLNASLASNKIFRDQYGLQLQLPGISAISSFTPNGDSTILIWFTKQ